MLSRIFSCSVIVAICLAPARAQDAPAAGPAPAAGKPAVGTDAAQAVTDEQAAAAAAALKKGTASEDAATRIAALREAAGVDHDDVARVAAGELSDKDATVRVTAAEVLGGMTCRESLQALHRAAKEKKNIEDSRTATALFKAIGRHGDASSIPVLANEPFKNPDVEVVRARIMAIGNIRSKKSIEELMKLMQLGNPMPGQDSPFMPTFRVALARLTGTDQTTNKDTWQSWWRDNKNHFEMAERPPELAPELQSQWDEYWAQRGEAKPAAPAEQEGGERR